MHPLLRLDRVRTTYALTETPSSKTITRVRVS